MSDGEFHAYVALLVFSALVLSVLAVRGFGQSVGARVVDGLFAAGFLGYATYLIVADPDTVSVFFYAFAAPLVAVGHAVQARGRAKARRRAAGFSPQPYAGEAATAAARPFPAPPPPLGTPIHTPDLKPSMAAEHNRYTGLPSGLPAELPDLPPEPWRPAPYSAPSGLSAAGTATASEMAGRFPARPSGLPAPDPRYVDVPGGSGTSSPHAEDTGRHTGRHARPEPGDEGRHHRPEDGPPPAMWRPPLR